MRVCVSTCVFSHLPSLADTLFGRSRRRGLKCKSFIWWEGAQKVEVGGEGNETGKQASMCCRNELVLPWAARKSCRGPLEEPCRFAPFYRISQNGRWVKPGHLPADPPLSRWLRVAPRDCRIPVLLDCVSWCPGGFPGEHGT